MRVAMSSSGKPVLVIVLSASIISFVAVFSSSAMTSKRNRMIKGKRRKRPKIYMKKTERNLKILSDASDDLLSEPWCLSNCHISSFFAQFRPPPLYPSPFFGKWGRMVKRHSEIIPTSNLGNIEVEYIEPVGLPNPAPSSTPIIIILHGVSGHSREPYVEQAALHIAVDKGWRALIFNYGKVRTVNSDNKGVKETNKSVLLGGHNFMDGGDLNFLISHLRKTYPSTFIAAIGFSMGGAKLVQYLGRTKENCNLDAAGVISAPLDFTKNNHTVYGGGFIYGLYHFAISSALKLWILKNYRELIKHPKICTSKPFRKTKSGLLWWLKSHRVTDVDDAITIHAKGYKTLHDYYQDASVIEKLRNDVTIPFLCLTALNDPFVPIHIIPTEDVAEDNENVFIVNTKFGGHIGFWLPGKGCWATKGCLSFLESVRKNVPIAEKSRGFRRQISIKAAEYLRRTSSNKLTDYYQLLDTDSKVEFEAFLGEKIEEKKSTKAHFPAPGSPRLFHGLNNLTTQNDTLTFRNRAVVQGGWV